MTRLAIHPALILAVWTAAATAAEPDFDAAADAAQARAVVESLHGLLVECMKEANTLGFEGRFQRIGAKLGESFDLPFVARNSIGATWKELTAEQRLEFIELSRRLSAARYASNFDSYEEQRFDTHSVKPAARGTLIVTAELVQPRGRDVRFDYRLRKTPEGWRIIDVVVDGSISEVVLWRGQYRSVIETEGYPKLVEAMQKKIEALSRK